MRVKYYCKLYFLLSAQYMKARMSYKEDFIISIIGMLMLNSSGFLVLWIVFQSIPSLGGWSYDEMVFIYSYTLLSTLPLQLFFDKIWDLSGELIDGTFIKYRLKPMNIMFYFVSQKIDIKAFGQLIFGSAALVYSSSKLNVIWSVDKVALMAILLFFSALVLISMMLLANSITFKTFDPGSCLNFVFRLRDYAHYPVDIFNSFFRFMFTYILPIGYIAFYPCKLLLRADEADFLVYISPLVGIIFFAVAYRIWIKNAMEYVATGT